MGLIPRKYLRNFRNRTDQLIHALADGIVSWEAEALLPYAHGAGGVLLLNLS